MTFHIFNPDHDIALAMNIIRFSSPRAARLMRRDLDFIPALWATKGDTVIVEDVDVALKAYDAMELSLKSDVNFITPKQIPQMLENKRIIDIQPWGWNKSICDYLMANGMPEKHLPSIRQLNKIRDLSNRRLAVKLLDIFKDNDRMTGFSRTCDTYEQFLLFLDQNKDVVVKSPWSCSGRGVKFISSDNVTENQLHWVVNTIEKQHSVTAEIRCDNVLDFAALFMVDNFGRVRFHGLSLFTTENGAYTGNVLCSDKEKELFIYQYIPKQLLFEAIYKIESFLTENISDAYSGPLGVDMMICQRKDGDGYLLNPCVEINLRRTMGHVALSLSRRGQRGSMAVGYDGEKYSFQLNNFEPFSKLKVEN